MLLHQVLSSKGRHTRNCIANQLDMYMPVLLLDTYSDN